MKQIVIVVIVAALGLAAWKFWPQIQATIQKDNGQGNGENKKGGSPDPKIGANTKGPTTTTDGGPGDPMSTTGPKTPVTPKISDPGTPKATQGFKVEIEVKLVTQRKQSRIEGMTNLPVGTELSCNFVSAGGDARRGAIRVEKGPVRNVFRSPAYVLSGDRYDFEFVMDPTGQSAAAQQLFGPSGERLQGPAVTTMGNTHDVFVIAQVRRVARRLTVEVVLGDKALAAKANQGR